jgi:hypothetical protein
MRASSLAQAPDRRQRERGLERGPAGERDRGKTPAWLGHARRERSERERHARHRQRQRALGEAHPGFDE